MRINFKAVLGIVLSLLLLAWVLHDVSFAQVIHEIGRADPFYFSLATLIATLAIPVRALRWRSMLDPVAPGISFRARNAATAIGFAANNLFPARVGEFARAFTLGRLTGLPVSTALGTLVIERVFDGIAIVGLLFLAMGSPAFPSTAGGVDPRHVAAVIGAAMLAATGVLFLLVHAPERSLALAEAVATRVLPERAARLLIDLLRAFLGGLAVLRSPRLFLISLGWAVAQWGFLALSYWFALLAFHITEPGFAGAVFLQSSVSLAVAIPSSPGFFGPFEGAAKLVLGLWQVRGDAIVSFAIAFHLAGFITVTLLGLWYAWRLNLRWGQLEKSEAAVEEGVEAETRAQAASREG